MKNKNIDKQAELLAGLKYNYKDLQSRLDLVNELFGMKDYGGVSFPDDYWIDLFEPTFNSNGVETSQVKVFLNQGDPLYEETKTAKLLEIVGTYLLNSNEVKEKEKAKKLNERIKVYNSREMFLESIKDSEKVRNLKPTDESELSLKVFVKQRNFKKDKHMSIHPSMLKASRLAREYNGSLVQMQARQKAMTGRKLEKKEVQFRNRLRKQIGLLKKDVIDGYCAERPPIKFKAPLKDNGQADYSVIDFIDPDTIKNLLQIQKENDIGSDLNCILLDLEDLIKRTPLSQRQREILELYRLGATITEIGACLGTTSKNISQSIITSSKNISKQYLLELEDHYYLNIRKGEYRTCTGCGEVKLISHFYKDNSKGGYKRKCKKCLIQSKKEKKLKEVMKNEN